MNSNSDFLKLIEEIKEKADIVAIIGQYVHLEKKGANYIGLCPFHDDKNPSMSVSPSKRIFKCFSCNAKGDVIKFVQNYKHITYYEALREVGKTVGIEVAMTHKEIEEKKYEKYYNITRDATSYFTFYLHNAVDGDKALKYLEERKLSIDVLKHFNIGLASNGNDDLYNVLKEQHLPIDMVSVGLLRENDAKFYDVFKDRIIFPIENLDGKVVGFSGRRYKKEQDSESKYINTSETIIFKKGQILYNYKRAFEAIREQKCVYLFEGFMDVIAAYRAGVYNTVASMGTSLTVDQIRAMKRLTDTIIVCYDGDDPGVEATKRAISMIMQEGLNCKVVSMPEGIDPDEYINAFGEEALKNYLLNKTTSGIDFFYEKAYAKLNIDDLSSLEAFKKTVFSYLHLFNSNLIVDKVLNRMSKDINVSLDALKADFSSTLIDPVSFDNPYEPEITEDKKIFVPYNSYNYPEKYYNAEVKLLLIAYKHIDKTPMIVKKLENNSVDEKNSLLINHLYQLNMTDKSISTEEDILPLLSNDEKELIASLLNYAPYESNDSIETIDILCDLVKTNSYEKRYKELNDKRLQNTLTPNEAIEMLELKKLVTKRRK